ncbi:MAG TPA: hypothetical protein VFU46_10580 [Gemmatimonadales bacterium]|nr:hypothetical protein [Gemmatimonadales bacterium]
MTRDLPGDQPMTTVAPPPEPHHIRVERTARYYLLGTPGPAVRECWFVLHGYGQLAAPLARRTAALARPGALVVAPEALSRFYVDPPSAASHAAARVGASWMTRDDREAEIADYVAYLDRVRAEVERKCGGAPLTIRVLGFSQAAATAFRWAALGSGDPPRTLLLWAGPLPAEISAEPARERLRSTEIVLAGGDSDPFVSRDDLDRGAAELGRLGYRVRTFTFPGEHTVTAEALAGAIA